MLLIVGPKCFQRSLPDGVLANLEPRLVVLSRHNQHVVRLHLVANSGAKRQKTMAVLPRVVPGQVVGAAVLGSAERIEPE